MEALPKTPSTNKKRESELEAPSSSPPNEPLKVPKRSEISPGSLQSPVGSNSQASDLTPKATYKERKNSGTIVLDVPVCFFFLQVTVPRIFLTLLCRFWNCVSMSVLGGSHGDESR